MKQTLERRPVIVSVPNTTSLLGALAAKSNKSRRFREMVSHCESAALSVKKLLCPPLLEEVYCEARRVLNSPELREFSRQLANVRLLKEHAMQPMRDVQIRVNDSARTEDSAILRTEHILTIQEAEKHPRQLGEAYALMEKMGYICNNPHDSGVRSEQLVRGFMSKQTNTQTQEASPKSKSGSTPNRTQGQDLGRSGDGSVHELAGIPTQPERISTKSFWRAVGRGFLFKD